MANLANRPIDVCWLRVDLGCADEARKTSPAWCRGGGDPARGGNPWRRLRRQGEVELPDQDQYSGDFLI